MSFTVCQYKQVVIIVGKISCHETLHNKLIVNKNKNIPLNINNQAITQQLYISLSNIKNTLT